MSASGRLLDAAAGIRRRISRRPSPRAQAGALALAMAVFIGGGVTAWRRLELDLGDISWAPIWVLIVVLVPLTIVANMAELSVTGRLLGVRIAPVLLLRTVLVATAANFLPIPGAALVRVHALRTGGAPLGAATSVTVSTALLWVSLSSMVAGAALVTIGGYALAAAFLGGGLLLGVLGVATLARHTSARTPLPLATLELCLVELALIVISAARILAVLVAIGIGASVTQTLVLTVAGALAATAGVFPGGLGLTEAISAALAPLVGLPAAAGFTATAMNRLAGIAVTAPLALLLGMDLLRRARQLERSTGEAGRPTGVDPPRFGADGEASDGPQDQP